MARFGRRLPVVEVVWRDSILFTGGWEPYKSVVQASRRVRQRTVGYVLRDDKDGVVLASSLGQGGDVYGVVSIPRQQVVRVRRL